MTILFNSSQLVSFIGGPRRGKLMNDIQIIPAGAVLYRDGIIQELGNSDDMIRKYPNEPRIDAHQRAVCPGFVDPHTHLVWAGDRASEFEMRLQGKTYLEILAEGGGILSTVRATREANTAQLLEETRSRAIRMVSNGTTTAEAKTGYGLSLESELRQLQVLMILSEQGPLELIPTFLAAHAIAPEYKQDPNGYTDLICTEMLPAVKEMWQREYPIRPLPFVDVFCEQGAFNLEQTRRILTAAKKDGFPLKIHADEFADLGGSQLAVDLHAATADHLVMTSEDGLKALAESDTFAIPLPCTPFGLADPHYSQARKLIDLGGRLAIATDCNPGTAWCESMQFVIALACRYMKLTPAEAFCAATINSAAAIGVEDKAGSLEIGKQADLIILAVDDYRHLAYRFGSNLIAATIKRGEVVFGS